MQGVYWAIRELIWNISLAGQVAETSQAPGGGSQDDYKQQQATKQSASKVILV